MSKWVLGVVGFLVALWIFWRWDSSEPVVQWEAPPALGKDFQLTLNVEDEGKGIGSIQVWLRQAGTASLVFAKENETVAPWERGPLKETVVVSASQLEQELSLSEGELEIVVEVTDQPNLWLLRRKTVDIKTAFYDVTAPRIEVISEQHYIRQGGSEALLYRVDEEGAQSGVQVGEHPFYGYRIADGGRGLSICLFALAHDQPTDTPIYLWARDIAGNRVETEFWYKTFSQDFRSSRIEVTDRLIQDVSRDVLSHTTEAKEKQTPIETFVEINSGLRKATHQRLAAITSSSANAPLWDQPFLQLSNSQVESRFADYRIYVYEGEEVDRQTHLGFDLASVAQSPVEASNSGTVVFADYLGIYGNTVILDHGLGLFSLYGHLSSFNVEKGQAVSRSDRLGRTGQSGLAAGDHLHFSMMVGGVQVDPLEWWDGKWVEDHVLSKLKGVSGGPS